jgi:hypothetical protein
MFVLRILVGGAPVACRHDAGKLASVPVPWPARSVSASWLIGAGWLLATLAARPLSAGCFRCTLGDEEFQVLD